MSRAPSNFWASSSHVILDCDWGRELEIVSSTPGDFCACTDVQKCLPEIGDTWKQYPNKGEQCAAIQNVYKFNLLLQNFAIDYDSGSEFNSDVP